MTARNIIIWTDVKVLAILFAVAGFAFLTADIFIFKQQNYNYSLIAAVLLVCSAICRIYYFVTKRSSN